MKKYVSDVSYLLLMPSFYGALMWLLGLILYYIRYIDWHATKPIVHIIFITTEIFFIVATFLFANKYKILVRKIKVQYKNSASHNSYFNNFYIIILHIIGLWGSYKFITDYANHLGGYEKFFFIAILSGKGYLIRAAGSDVLTIGTQISYVGWIAISLTIFAAKKRTLNLPLAITLCLIQFLPNLLYMDRTRPMWILFTVFISAYPIMYNTSKTKFLFSFLLTLIIGPLLFVLIALGSGRGWNYDSNDIIFKDIYLYMCSGYAYFNEIVGINSYSLFPERLMYPLLKLMSKASLVPEPPSQIIEFLEVPVSTNVGTLLEPFYSDGGISFVLIGIIVYTMGFNLLAYFLLKARKISLFYVVANICFINFIGFFTPKIATFPIWFIFFICIIASIFQKKINYSRFRVF